MNERRADNVDIFKDKAQMSQAMRKAIRETVRIHKLLGYPIVIWRDGKIVWVPAEEIQLDVEATKSPESSG